MKDLIKDIKYNRFPKEVLMLLNLLNDESKYTTSPILGYEKRVFDDRGRTLFMFQIKKKIIYYNYTTIKLLLTRTFGVAYRFNICSVIIMTAIENSIYSEYTIL